jgi:nucleoside phosphorylase
MIAIVFTTEEEAQPFLQRYERGRLEGIQEGETVEDDLLLVSLVGTGKIKATLRTERLLRQHRPSVLVHAGTCTALRNELALGSMVAASQVFEGDRIELAAPSYPRMPLDVPFEGLQQVTLVTQDHIVKGQTEQTYWQRIADVSDMTGYAVAYVTATYGIPCHIVKVITGHIDSQDVQLRKTMSTAHEAIGAFLLKQIPNLKNR